MSYESFTESCLSALKPSAQICESCLKENPYDIVPYVQEFILTCQEKGKDVFLVSGGYVPVFLWDVIYLQMITPLLPMLHISSSHLYAIPILFGKNGEYLGYDKSADVTKMDGKGIIATKLLHSCFETVD